MKNKLLLISCFMLAAATFAACGGTASSSSAASAPSSAPVSQPAAASSEAPAPSSAPSEAASEPADDNIVNVGAILEPVVEAAGLGGTIDVTELDLTAGGIDTANILNFIGAESQLAVENGGIVLVFQVSPGTADGLVSQLEAFRDTRASDDRYAEFEQARTNTSQARIVAKDDVVVYAVSALGADGLDALDAAIDAAL